MDIKNPGEIKNSKDNKNNKLDFEIKALLSAVALMMLAVFAILVTKFNYINPLSPIFTAAPEKPITKNISDIEKFSSEQDFKEYLDASSKLSLSNGYGGGGFGASMITNEATPVPGMLSKNSADSSAPDRISGTNIQVAGIDEPDIVKTDGKEIYFSGIQNFYPMMRSDISPGISLPEQKMIAPYPYPAPQEKTNIIKAFPPANLALDGKIDKQGNLLLDNNNLIIFSNYGYSASGQEINSYDISNPKSPAKKWTMKLDNDTSIVASRLRDGKIYLITKNNINTAQLCPLKPLSIDGVDLTIKCADIYHPIAATPIDSTFVAMALNPDTGKIENTVSFVGSSSLSVVYVSENAIYATYTYNESIVKLFNGFISENRNFFPADLVEKIGKLNSYDISEISKITELTAIMEKYANSLGNDDRLKLENEMQNRMNDYYKIHQRELEKTSIVKINTDNFTISAKGEVPGHLLNNFAMDEYKGNLRVASTIGSRWGIFSSGSGSNGSISDITILDKDLNFIGSVKDLGKTEQIYSVRFIEDKGYVVTFRQTDPFYIINLANPKNPQMTGELKIPGYSSYLHPLDAKHILGIGQEGSQVKISLFDVSDEDNPIETDKYLLDEYWTEVSNNYHAFLLDTKHNIFFLPGSKGGYVFSFSETAIRPGICKEEDKNNCPDITKYGLELKKAISQNSVKRAIYLNDYLYIIGDDKITVLNELDWQKVNELDITN